MFRAITEYRCVYSELFKASHTNEDLRQAELWRHEADIKGLNANRQSESIKWAEYLIGTGRNREKKE